MALRRWCAGAHPIAMPVLQMGFFVEGASAPTPYR
jgi:hypothetical protein